MTPWCILRILLKNTEVFLNISPGKASFTLRSTSLYSPSQRNYIKTTPKCTKSLMQNNKGLETVTVVHMSSETS